MTVLLVLGWVGVGLLALLGLVFLLLLPSVRLHFSARDGDIKISVHYLFLRYGILPQKEKPAKKPKKHKEKLVKEEEPEEPAKKQKPSISMMWEQYRPLIRKGGKTLKTLCKRMVIYKVRARVKICDEDAHKTALKYAKITSGAAVFLQVISRVFTLKKTDMQVLPDFLGESSGYDISFRLRVRPLHIVTAGVVMLIAYLKTLRRGRNIKPRGINKRKGGRKHESTAASYK